MRKYPTSSTLHHFFLAEEFRNEWKVSREHVMRSNERKSETSQAREPKMWVCQVFGNGLSKQMCWLETSNAKRTYHEIISVDRKFWLYYTFKHFQFIVVHPKYTCLKFDFFNPLNIYDLYICTKKRTNVLYGYRWFLIYSFASLKGTPYVFLSPQGIRLHLDELAHTIALIKRQFNIETREECINLSHI